MKTLAALALTVATLAGAVSLAETVQAETADMVDSITITAESSP